MDVQHEETPNAGVESSKNERNSSFDPAISTGLLQIENSPPRSALLNSNPFPQNAPGASAAIGHTVENSIPLSIFPIQADKLCLCFCGKPARGKTQISRRVARYLSFFHAMPLQIFNVGEYRRRSGFTNLRDFDQLVFQPGYMERRDQCNEDAMNDMVEYMKGSAPRMAIYDAVNFNHGRRMAVYQKMREVGTKVVFVEVINENQEFLKQQYLLVAQTSPDYTSMSVEEATSDYKRRVDSYCLHYVPLSADHPIESRWSYFQCNHANSHFVIHKATGYYFTKVIHFIMNMNTSPHSFYLSRHGESEYNEVGRIGGNSSLSPNGRKYMEAIAEFAAEKINKDPVTGEDLPTRLWTSTMIRTIETASMIPSPVISVRDPNDPTNVIQWQQMRRRAWCNLDELYAGSCDGMTYEEIEEQFPEEFLRRKTDKLAYRYPRGESYLDVIARLEPMIMEMERHREPLLIISHQGILRIIYAFYMGLNREDAPYASIPLNTVLELTPNAFGCSERRHVLVGFKTDDGQNEPHSKCLESKSRNDDPPSH